MKKLSLLLKSILRNEYLGCLFWIALFAGIIFLINHCIDTHNSNVKAKAEAKKQPKPCYIDTTNIAWYSNDSTITEFTISTARELVEFAGLAKCGNSFNNKIIKPGADIILNDTTDW